MHLDLALQLAVLLCSAASPLPGGLVLPAVASCLCTSAHSTVTSHYCRGRAQRHGTCAILVHYPLLLFQRYPLRTHRCGMQQHGPCTAMHTKWQGNFWLSVTFKQSRQLEATLPVRQRLNSIACQCLQQACLTLPGILCGCPAGSGRAAQHLQCSGCRRSAQQGCGQAPALRLYPPRRSNVSCTTGAFAAGLGASAS